MQKTKNKQTDFPHIELLFKETEHFSPYLLATDVTLSFYNSEARKEGEIIFCNTRNKIN